MKVLYIVERDYLQHIKVRIDQQPLARRKTVTSCYIVTIQACHAILVCILNLFLLTLVGNDLRDQFARYTEQRKQTALVSFTVQSPTVLPENCIHMAKQAVAPRHGLAWHFARMTVCNSINTIVSWDNGNYSSICYLLCNYFLMSKQAVLNIIEGIRTQYCDWTLHTMCDSFSRDDESGRNGMT